MSDQRDEQLRRLAQLCDREIERHGPDEKAVVRAMFERVKADPALFDAAVHMQLEHMVEEELTRQGAVEVEPGVWSMPEKDQEQQSGT